MFEALCQEAWSTGEPGLVFWTQSTRRIRLRAWKDRRNKPMRRTTIASIRIMQFSSIDISKYVKNKKIDWEKLESTVEIAVRF